MNWTTAEDLKTQVNRLWDRGILLRVIMGEGDPDVFPLRLRLKTPSPAELMQHFASVRPWIDQLSRLPHVRIERLETRHRVLGKQSVPVSAWIDDAESAFRLVGKESEAAKFRELLEITRATHPLLLPWVAKDTLRALALAEAWSRLLAVVDWVKTHPRPGIYLRQVDISGVDSKFIEGHRGALSALLDLSLPTQAIDSDRSGVCDFAQRYGFLDKPRRIRFRILDSEIALLPDSTLEDLEVDEGTFANLRLPLRRVFVTENEINFLCFPPVPGAIVIFGSGYAIGILATAVWLADMPLHYWGDLDTHGFAMLDALRRYFRHVRSFLMDAPTLYSHQEHWGTESDPISRDLARLTETERQVYDDLRYDRVQKGLRLEQERIGFRFVEAALDDC